MENFNTLHDILQETILDKSYHLEEPANNTYNFRIEGRLKERAQEICRGNGTDLSRFLRKTCETLVKEYTEPLELS